MTYTLFYFSDIITNTGIFFFYCSEIMKPITPEYSLDMPSTAGTYTRQLDSLPTGHTPATSRESPSLVGSEAHMVESNLSFIPCIRWKNKHVFNALNRSKGIISWIPVIGRFKMLPKIKNEMGITNYYLVMYTLYVI